MSEEKQVLDDDVMVTLELDNGEQMPCEIITIFDMNEQDYIVLEPQETANDPDAEETELFVYRYFENGDEYYLENIQNDEEYEMVAERIDELLDEAYYEEM